MSDRISVMYSEEEVNAKIKEIGDKISKDYENQEVLLICVLKGATFFACELAKRITVPVELEFMKVSSYGNETESSGVVKITQDLDQPIRGKHVIVVEDIVDTGRTLSYLLELLKKRDPASVALCTLLDKPERRVADVAVDYTGFVIPDEFVVGYGLDYAQKYRNLPFVGIIKPE
ncbi:MAG: hypoxanthine phosphoribosyltransferase [Lachnospiraceae bacterium]|nr:hypoxanthine phosphoribosyltransferase [Lachnospiraceae bacterium]